jgi:hypothetical protein
MSCFSRIVKYCLLTGLLSVCACRQGQALDKSSLSAFQSTNRSTTNSSSEFAQKIVDMFDVKLAVVTDDLSTNDIGVLLLEVKKLPTWVDLPADFADCLLGKQQSSPTRIRELTDTDDREIGELLHGSAVWISRPLVIRGRECRNERILHIIAQDLERRSEFFLVQVPGTPWRIIMGQRIVY